MDTLSLVPTVYAKFPIFILIWTRISAFFSAFILFRQDWVSPKILVSLSAILALYVLFLNPTPHLSFDSISLSLVINEIIQFLLGFIGALILNIVFEVISAAGQLISLEIGLSMISIFDPKLGNITKVTHLYVFTILILFFLMNGHLFIVQTIVDSFTAIPIDNSAIPTRLISKILEYSKIIFTDSIILAITVIVAILITNFSLAILSKFAPQFNIFSIGTNLTLIIGLIIVYITFNVFLDKSQELIGQGLEFLRHSLVRSH